MKRFRNALFALVLTMLFGSQAYAEPPYFEEQGSQQSSGGGTTNQTTTAAASNPVIIIPDTFTEPAPLLEPEAPPPSIGAGFGLIAIWSSHVQAYVLPASYKIFPDLKVEASIPYIRKKLKGEYTDEELTASGIGDVSVGLKYRYGNEEILQGVTTVTVKFPTGDYKQFENRTEQLALGSGSYDFSINQTLSRIIGPFRILANVGYRLNTKNDYVETDIFGRNVEFESRTGNIFNYLLGVQYETPLKGLLLYLNASGLFQERSHIKETDTADGSIIRDEDKRDRLGTLDLNLGAMLMLTANTGFRLGVFIPLATEFDPDVNDHASREWVTDFGFLARF
ncbi:MAG: transporter [Deltaproteobacteria bacterium]|nr:transporter [Deltaproteobacteria bacterium]